MTINYMDFTDRAHWNGDGVRNSDMNKKVTRLKRNTAIMKRIKEKTFQEVLEDIKRRADK